MKKEGRRKGKGRERVRKKECHIRESEKENTPAAGKVPKKEREDRK